MEGAHLSDFFFAQKCRRDPWRIWRLRLLFQTEIESVGEPCRKEYLGRESMAHIVEVNEDGAVRGNIADIETANRADSVVDGQRAD